MDITQAQLREFVHPKQHLDFTIAASGKKRTKKKKNEESLSRLQVTTTAAWWCVATTEANGSRRTREHERHWARGRYVLASDGRRRLGDKSRLMLNREQEEGF